MAITVRRVFRAKVGQASAVVGLLREFAPVLQRQGGAAGARIYTDFLCGPTDRVVWEWDVDGLAALEGVFARVQADAAARREVDGWFERLAPLIDGATVEIWRREE